MRLQEKYPPLVSVFIEASRNLKRTFQTLKMQKKINTISAYTESTDLIFKAFKTIIHLVTLSLSIVLRTTSGPQFHPFPPVTENGQKNIVNSFSPFRLFLDTDSTNLAADLSDCSHLL
jgi:hypothetical protein